MNRASLVFGWFTGPPSSFLTVLPVPIVCLESSCHLSFRETRGRHHYWTFFFLRRLYFCLFEFLIVLGIVRNKLLEEMKEWIPFYSKW